MARMRETEAERLLDFVETTVFVQQLAQLAGKREMDLLNTIQNDLLMDSQRGDLMKGLGGVRKARVADPRKQEGKSGGFRYLYLYMTWRGRIHLLYIYSKREQLDLTPEQKKEIAALVDILKKAEKKR